jgi:hypothetical protein
MRDARAAMPGTRGAAILLLVVAVLSFGCATMSALESIESLLQQAKELLDAKKYDEALTKITGGHPPRSRAVEGVPLRRAGVHR